jgi:taurine dioxygenase
MDGVTTRRFEVQPLHPFTGAEIAGLDLAEPLGAGPRAALGQLLAERGVLVFRSQNLDPRSFARAVENFGELMPPPLPGGRFAPAVGFVSNAANPARPSYGTDLSHHPAPPRATALYGVSIPHAGGDTQLVNMQAAYDALPADLRKRLETLKSQHVAPPPERLPTAVQPLVSTHPLTGRRGLFLDPARMAGILGMERGAADALIADLVRRATAKRYEYRHRWRVGDLVIWDNRTVLHKDNADVPPQERIYLYRVLVKGTPLL